ncbi:MAG: type II toxin-antitoxin system VapC family toxin [Candidatus Kariarchaeaceae archaeon]|jgi:predicted nucleic acid-binding protein
MVSVFIDANIFLEVQLEQEQSEGCKKLLKYLEKSDEIAWTNSFLVFSMLLTIQHKTADLEKCKRFITILNSYNGLHVFNPGFSTIFNALDIQKQYSLDFDDSLVVSSMDQLKISHIVTYDQDFDKIDRIIVLKPIKAFDLLTGS